MPPRSSYHHGDLRRALTEAALALVGERGPKGFSLSEVARRAGVSAAAPYRHFTDKAALLARVAQLGFEQLGATLAAAPDRGSGRDRLVDMSRRYVRWALEHPDFYLVMFGAEVKRPEHVELVRASEAALEVLLAAIEDARVGGELVIDDPTRLAGSLWSVVHGTATLAIGGELQQSGVVTPAEDLAALTITILVGGGTPAPGVRSR
jgi:AcrR family transcriptional regulator